MNQRAEILLPGCSPTPLSSYLKALGVLRIVGEQLDADARGAWREEAFVLTSTADEIALQSFLLNEYAPTPIVAPWNGGSGFYKKDKKEGIDPIAASQAQRFASYQEAISACRKALQELKLTASPKKETKMALLRLLRAAVPDAALAWIDAAVVLTGNDLRYPPLLGTGGNDGRLDFTNNFMQRLVELLDATSGKPRAGASRFLRSSLFGEATPSLASKAVGQFHPGGVGGPNAAVGFDAGFQVNPWDFVLMIEGTLVFAGSATRRLSTTGHTHVSYPFTVRVTGRGAGNSSLADEADARAETWFPLWNRPATIREIRSVFSEGRLTLGRRVAEDGLDVVRAIAALGVDRGVSAFQRYSFLKRSGKAFLAVPMNRVRVRRNVDADIIADLDRRNWLYRIRRRARDKNAPARFLMLACNLDDALFDMTRRRGEPAAVQAGLIAVAAMERHVGSSPRLHEDLRPVGVLDQQWVEPADDGSPEFRVAAAVASLHAVGRFSSRSFFYPVQTATGRATSRSGGFTWAPGNCRYVWRQADFPGCMIAVLSRRLLEAKRTAAGSDATGGGRSRSKPVDGRRSAGLAAVQVLLNGTLDEPRTRALIESLVLARPVEKPPRPSEAPDFLPAAYALLKLLFVPEKALVRMEVLADGRTVPVPAGLIRALSTGYADDAARALQTAVRRLCASGVAVGVSNLDPAGLDPRRLAAALLVPLAWTDIGTICGWVCARREKKEGVSV